MATLTGGLAAAVLGGDVNAGASAGGNAAQNNFVCGGLCVAGVIIGAGAIYSTIVGEGDPLEGLAQIGSGSDPLSAAISSGVNAGIELSLEAYPEQTLAALGVLEAIGETADLAVTYVDEATGKTVSTNWNKLPERLRNQIKGGTTIAAIAIPGGSIAKLRALKKASKGGTTVAATNRTQLINELMASGTKVTLGNVVDIRNINGRTVWLEMGNSRAGLQHIVGEHGSEFAQRGISEAEIPDLLFTALQRDNVVGYQGRGTGRPIYEFEYGGQTHRLAITVGDHGFVVGANFR
ncbi:VENN motif pre-toxin domain-containing protein [Notoacmeibacter marinus]|uniref:VENN motif pre-toxin domain-containing protein n=1 Tax=Notoacmeibacter marinus TaxID=1876515 RepID=UPI000DF4107F|nr:hypothetical protein [Notoacmeibacter marinus]